MLLVPPDFAAGCAPEDFLAALAHECAHARRHDFQKNLFYEAVSLALAFHPAIWAIKTQIAQTREMVCDSMVTERALDSRNYAHSLLRLAAMVGVSSRAAAAHAIGIFDANILEKRIMMINLKKRQVNFALKYGLLVPAVILLPAVAVGAAAVAVVVEPQSATQAADQASLYGHVYKVGKDVSAPVCSSPSKLNFPRPLKIPKRKLMQSFLSASLWTPRACLRMSTSSVPINRILTQRQSRRYDSIVLPLRCDWGSQLPLQ